MVTENKRCKSLNRNGEPCQGYAMADGYCFSHSPELEEKRLEARTKGGRNSAKSVRLRGLVPPRLVSVYDKLEAALSEVHSGELASKQATAMAAIARAMVAVITSGELEERMRKLEHSMEVKHDFKKTRLYD